MEIISSGKIKKSNNRQVSPQSQQTGFPSPATHYIEPGIDLNKELIINRDATFFVRVDGNGLAEHHISHKDVLIIDRSIKPKVNQLVLIVSEGEFKVIHFPSLSVEVEFTLWGVITYIIHCAR